MSTLDTKPSGNGRASNAWMAICTHLPVDGDMQIRA